MVTRQGSDTETKGRGKAAWTLAILAPVSAELTLGVTPLQLSWLMFPLLIPMYGAGVLLIREVTRRVGGGWPSLILLGMAYELVEDGIGLQALTSPTIAYNAAEWGPRVLGFNTAYWQAQTGYHIVFSVLIPIMLTDILFPQHRQRRYLKGRGLLGVGIAAIIGVGLIRAFVPPSIDPGYQTPLAGLVGIVVAVTVLTVLALVVLPARKPAPAVGTLAPRPATGGVVAALATQAFLILLFPLEIGDLTTFGDSAWMLIPMAVAALLAVVVGAAVHRWSSAPGWSDRHRIWLAGGALVSHSVFGILFFADDALNYTGLAVIIVLTVVLLATLARRREGPLGHSAVRPIRGQ